MSTNDYTLLLWNNYTTSTFKHNPTDKIYRITMPGKLHSFTRLYFQKETSFLNGGKHVKLFCCCSKNTSILYFINTLHLNHCHITCSYMIHKQTYLQFEGILLHPTLTISADVWKADYCRHILTDNVENNNLPVADPKACWYSFRTREWMFLYRVWTVLCKRCQKCCCKYVITLFDNWII